LVHFLFKSHKPITDRLQDPLNCTSYIYVFGASYIVIVSNVFLVCLYHLCSSLKYLSKNRINSLVYVYQREVKRRFGGFKEMTYTAVVTQINSRADHHLFMIAGVVIFSSLSGVMFVCVCVCKRGRETQRESEWSKYV
jgi:hypothetical protein